MTLTTGTVHCGTCVHVHVQSKPLNKGHFGTNINYVVLSFVERLSSFGGSKCIRST